jgi:hypothetical protein
MSGPIEITVGSSVDVNDVYGAAVFVGVEVGVAEPVPESEPPVIGPEPIVVSVGEAVPPDGGKVVAVVPVFVFVFVSVLVGVTDAVFVSVFVFEIVGPPGVVVTVGVTVEPVP